MGRSSKPPSELPNKTSNAEASQSDESALALDQLSAALAGMLESGADPYAEEPTETSPLEELVSDSSNCEVNPRTILEAMLFVGSPNNEPLSSRQVASLMRGVSPKEIDSLVRDLNLDYERRNCPYVISEEANGYRLTLRGEHDRLRDRFFGRTRMARLSQAAIEVLAAVAYHEPVTAEEVTKLRGTASGHVLAQLVRRQLLRLERSEDKSRHKMYWTTDRFLELFGLSSLADLPRSSELELPASPNE